MPNNVTNELTGLKQFVAMISKTDELQFDFNKIIPQPKCIIDGDVTSHVENAAKIALGLLPEKPTELIESLELENCLQQLKKGKMVKDFDDEEYQNFLSYIEAYRQTGFLTWHDWRLKHWGTKWNSYNVEIVNVQTIRFDTAWSAPHPVIENLYPHIKEPFTHKWADEDTGRNIGIRKYTESWQRETILDETKEGYELAFELHPGIKECYEFDEETQNYVYKEEE